MENITQLNTGLNPDIEPQAPILREAPILCGESRKVLVTGFFDLLNSGHVQFLKEAAEHGELYVGVGSDASFEELKGRQPICSEQERLYMVKAVRYVKDAFITECAPGQHAEVGKPPFHSYTARSADTAKPILSEAPILPKCRLPYRIDIAGTWIDQPYVSKYGAGWAITASIEPTHEFMERGGMSTSTRNAAKKIWPFELPAFNEEMLARLVFCFENDPENKGHVSGAQDAIGICISGLSRHYYDGHYWPERIETIHDEDILSWLEEHVCLVPMFPRRPGCSVVEGKDITPEKVRDLT
ncbi:MAG: adenylyltransferase/cytidyltransferase family protein, partial [Muribaculaceae bacterium]|nr:adenylyltransferase/cytidyltransferase family protein [Muribaculaceae bacterium]